MKKKRNQTCLHFSIPNKYFSLNRSRTTQEGSQGLWDYPQPTLDAPRDPKQHQKVRGCAAGGEGGRPQSGDLQQIPLSGANHYLTFQTIHRVDFTTVGQFIIFFFQQVKGGVIHESVLSKARGEVQFFVDFPTSKPEARLARGEIQFSFTQYRVQS